MCVLRRLIFSILLVVLISPASQSFAKNLSDGNDNVVGVWHLNLKKSNITSNAPKSQTRIYELHPNGIKATIDTVYPDGKSTTIQYIASYDSVEYPVTGSLQFDAIALKRIDDFTAEATLSHAGKEIAKARRVISEDGQTMTITLETHDIGGGISKNVSVFEKEK